MTNLRHVVAGGLTILALVTWGSIVPKSVNAACGGPFPSMPSKVWAKTGPGGGQVTLSWESVNMADRYAVEYGTTPGNYHYGAINIGGSSSTSYTVSSLASGTRYYFRLAAAHDCSSSPFSAEVFAGSGIGGAASVTKSTTGEVRAWSGPKIGEVTLKWSQKDDADNYHLVYGTKAGQNEYGALNIGKITEFTVRSLTAGKTYYFSLVPVKGDRALYTTQAVSAVALAPVPVVETQPANIIQPEIEQQPQPQSMEPEQTNPEVVAQNDEPQQETQNVQGIEDENTNQEIQPGDHPPYEAANQALKDNQTDDNTVINNPYYENTQNPQDQTQYSGNQEQDNQGDGYSEVRLGSPTDN